MTTLTLLSAKADAGTGHAEMLAINGTVTIAAQNSTACITITAAGTYTLAAVNATGIHAALLANPSSPVTVTASF